MSMQDPIADLLTRIRNAQMAEHTDVAVPYSKIKAAICEVLTEEGYIQSCTVAGDDAKRLLNIELRYHEGKPVIEELKRRARDNTPEDIRIAVPFYKPTRNQTDIVPDYYEYETTEWLVFPHELDALTPDELRAARPQVADIIESAKSA